ncbi:MAG: phosphoribosylformylglycinamidine synthase subunit PurS [Bacteroidetes bacterium]|nr:phosphoribosylformylglycinamidine synthase [Rhodothermaceae bacterium RA]RMH52394.1 MAG: phosphoribosylformylglycinamidine synthase subunit PurS [Bacteroidota bacterium]
MFKAHVAVTLRPSILDPQGKAIQHALHNLGATAIERVRVGKYIELWVEEDDEAAAEAIVREACEKLLANPVMEDFTIELERVEGEPA